MEEVTVKIRFTDQNPKATKLLLGGKGWLVIAGHSVSLTGFDTYSNESLDLVMGLSTLGSAANTLRKAKQKEVSLSIRADEIKCIYCDIAKKSFALLWRDYAFPFKVVGETDNNALSVAALLHQRFGKVVEERRLPIEHRRLLLLFTMVLALIGFGILLFVVVYPALNIE